MKAKAKEAMVTITLPIDTANPEIKTQRFQRDGKDFIVNLGQPSLVPVWVAETALDIGLITSY